MKSASVYLLECLHTPPEDREKPFNPEDPLRPIGVTLNPEFILYPFENVTGEFHGGLKSLKGPQALEPIVNWALCERFLSAIPKIAERYVRFERLVTDLRPPDGVLELLAQAMRCYFYGLPDAAVALCRACLEHSLRHIAPSTRSAELEDLIKWTARMSRRQRDGKLLDDVHISMATQVRTLGNKVLHREAISMEQAADCLMNLRTVLARLFSDGGFRGEEWEYL